MSSKIFRPFSLGHIVLNKFKLKQVLQLFVLSLAGAVV